MRSGCVATDVKLIAYNDDGLASAVRGRPMKAYIDAQHSEELAEIEARLARFLATGELPQRLEESVAPQADYDDGSELGFLYDALPNDFFSGKITFADAQQLIEAVEGIDPDLGRAVREKLRHRRKRRAAS